MTTTLHKRDIGKRTCVTTTDSNSHLDGPSPGAVQSTPDPVDREALRRAILDHLDAIGVDRNQSEAVLDKPSIRTIHHMHRKTARQRIRRALKNKIDLFMDKIANGDEVDPEKIRSEVIEASSGTKTGDLFRFATLLWSIPVSQGYTAGGFASWSRTGKTVS